MSAARPSKEITGVFSKKWSGMLCRIIWVMEGLDDGKGCARAVYITRSSLCWIMLWEYWYSSGSGAVAMKCGCNCPVVVGMCCVF